MSGHFTLLLMSLSLTACASDAAAIASAGTGAPPDTGGIMVPPTDPQDAIRSEFAGIKQRGTAEAYLLFAERHPGHPLAKEATRRAAAIVAKTPG